MHTVTILYMTVRLNPLIIQILNVNDSRYFRVAVSMSVEGTSTECAATVGA